MAMLWLNLGLICSLIVSGAADSSNTNPVQSVMTLLSNLKAKITTEGEAEEKAFKEFMTWCDEAEANAGFDIKTATAEKEELTARIAKCESDTQVATAHISELVASIASSDSDKQNATSIRNKEKKEFFATEEELLDAISVLERAISVLEREMAKNPAFLQKVGAGAGFKGMVQALDAVINAASFSIQDRKKLMALVQSKQQEATDDQEDEFQAPEAPIYRTKSTNIVDVLEDLKEKAEAQLAEARKAETNAAHNFELTVQSLTDEIANLNKELGDTKSAKAESEECTSQAQGAMTVTVKELAAAKSAQATVETDCKTAEEDHKASVESRGQELEAITEAIKVLSSKVPGAESRVYSFLQVDGSAISSTHSRLHTSADLAQFELVAMVKKLARQEHSTELAQLASRIDAVVRFGTGTGQDPFAKVKTMIQNLIDRLEKDAGIEASHKAYCDEEMAKTDAKKADLTSDIDTLSAKLDKAAASSAELKGEVAELQKGLASLAKLQSEMDSARSSEHAAFVEEKATLEEGLQGIQQAMHILREYYSTVEESAFMQDSDSQQPETPVYHTKAQGAGSSIISMLEVISSDFSKSLAQATVAEEEAQTQYEKMTQENKIRKVTDEQSVTYKTQEFKGLDKAVAEHSSDREGLQAELSAVLEYSEKLVEQCVVKPSTYEERKARRTAEIEGLKEALRYLEGESLLQEHHHGSSRKARFLRQSSLQ